MATADRSGRSGPVGIALVDKPEGWTSHDVVAKARKLLGTRKIGHSGTLDPDATGLLVLGVGKATRLMQFLTGLPKVYTGDAVLGAATTTLDASGEVTGTWDMSAVTLADVQAAAQSLTGDIEQVPPMVSAKKVQGRRLHELARAGQEIERRPVPVTVHRFGVGPQSAPGVHPIAVECSSGTYIRSLVDDLGMALGGGAHLRGLRRTSVGAFNVEQAVTLEELTPASLMPPLVAFSGQVPVVVTDATEKAVRHGQVLPAQELAPGDQLAQMQGSDLWPVVDTEQNLLAVYVPHRGATLKPAVVLVP